MYDSEELFAIFLGAPYNRKLAMVQAALVCVRFGWPHYIVNVTHVCSTMDVRTHEIKFQSDKRR